jgi:predicted N-acetyltransferase YhbS
MSNVSLSSICIGSADHDLHAAFFDYVRKTFGHNADFLAWSRAGGWNDSYRAFALVDESREIVANVSVTQMDLLLEGERLRGFQFGAVGTVPTWRGRGLSRRLIEEVIEKLEPEADMILLFANKDVLDFYPRFGFRAQTEHVFGADHPVTPGRKISRLVLENPESQALLRRLCRSAEPVTGRFGARAYDSILFWHALSYFRADVFYLPDQDAVIVARTREETLILFEILSAQPFDLAAVLPGIADTPTRRLEFEFAPERWWPSAVPIRRYTGDQLFVRSSRSMPAEPFKFPSLAHT